jgi:hypothetical protein
MIPADYTTLMRQAYMTADDYMLNAKHDIDKTFGEGYAKAHPELVAAYMKTAAMDLSAATLTKELGEAFTEVAAAIAGLKTRCMSMTKMG